MRHSAILGFGFYLPSLRITTATIARAHGEDPLHYEKALGVKEKTVPAVGEDTFTMAFEAGKKAIQIATIDPLDITAVFVGSESHPYAVKPTSSMLVHALQCSPFSHAADLEFACKAGTAAMQIIDSMVRSGQIRYGLAIGSDTAQAQPGDALEYTAAAGAAAFVLGSADDSHALCRLDVTASYATDTPDFWRANGEQYPEHGGRFTGEPGYFHHMRTMLQALLSSAAMAPADFDHVVLHMPNAKFPMKIAHEFGFTEDHMRYGFIVPSLGNTYSACSPLGLAHVLQHAKKGERILLCSYGSGAGCDSFICTMLRDGIMHPSDPRPRAYLEYHQLLQATHMHR